MDEISQFVAKAEKNGIGLKVCMVAMKLRLKVQENCFPNANDDIARTCLIVGGLCRKLGLLDKAVEFFKKRSEFLSRGSDGSPRCNEQIAKVEHSIGMLCCVLGKLSDAEIHLRHCLRLREGSSSDTASPSMESPAIADGCLNLGAVLKNSNDSKKVQEAAELFHRALKIREKALLKESDSKVLICLDSLASTLLKLGKHSDALPYMNRSLRIVTSFKGPSHVDVAMTSNNMGTALHVLGRNEEALAMFESAARIWGASKSANSSNIALVHYNLGVVLKALGKYQAALPHLEKSLDRAIGSWGMYDLQILKIMDALGEVLTNLGKTSEADSMYQRTEVIRKKLFPTTEEDGDADEESGDISLKEQGEGSTSQPRVPLSSQKRQSIIEKSTTKRMDLSNKVVPPWVGKLRKEIEKQEREGEAIIKKQLASDVRRSYGGWIQMELQPMAAKFIHGGRGKFEETVSQILATATSSKPSRFDVFGIFVSEETVRIAVGITIEDFDGKTPFKLAKNLSKQAIDLSSILRRSTALGSMITSLFSLEEPPRGLMNKKGIEYCERSQNTAAATIQRRARGMAARNRVKEIRNERQKVAAAATDSLVDSSLQPSQQPELVKSTGLQDNDKANNHPIQPKEVVDHVDSNVNVNNNQTGNGVDSNVDDNSVDNSVDTGFSSNSAAGCNDGNDVDIVNSNAKPVQDESEDPNGNECISFKGDMHSSVPKMESVDTEHREIVAMLPFASSDVSSNVVEIVPPTTPSSKFKNTVELAIQHSQTTKASTASGLDMVSTILSGILAAERDPNRILSKKVLTGCLEGDLPRVAMALHEGASPMCKTDSGRYALGIAAEKTHASIVALLLKKNAQVNAADEHSGWTALHHACKTELRGPLTIKTVKVLLEANAQLNILTSDKYRRNCLHIAAASDNSVILQILLEQGGGRDLLSQFDARGNMCVHVAAKSKARDAIRVLSEAGFDLKTTNRRGLTASDVAEERSDSGTVAYIEKTLQKQWWQEQQRRDMEREREMLLEEQQMLYRFDLTARAASPNGNIAQQLFLEEQNNGSAGSSPKHIPAHLVQRKPMAYQYDGIKANSFQAISSIQIENMNNNLSENNNNSSRAASHRSSSDGGGGGANNAQSRGGSRSQTPSADLIQTCAPLVTIPPADIDRLFWKKGEKQHRKRSQKRRKDKGKQQAETALSQALPSNEKDAVTMMEVNAPNGTNSNNAKGTNQKQKGLPDPIASNSQKSNFLVLYSTPEHRELDDFIMNTLEKRRIQLKKSVLKLNFGGVSSISEISAQKQKSRTPDINNENHARLPPLVHDNNNDNNNDVKSPSSPKKRPNHSLPPFTPAGIGTVLWREHPQEKNREDALKWRAESAVLLKMKKDVAAIQNNRYSKEPLPPFTPAGGLKNWKSETWPKPLASTTTDSDGRRSPSSSPPRRENSKSDLISRQGERHGDGPALFGTFTPGGKGMLVWKERSKPAVTLTDPKSPSIKSQSSKERVPFSGAVNPLAPCIEKSMYSHFEVDEEMQLLMKAVAPNVGDHFENIVKNYWKPHSNHK